MDPQILDYNIRPVQISDAETIARIYNYYIVNTVITFEEEEVSSDEISNRIREIVEADLPWLVIEHKGSLTGYAYASKWKSRCSYRFSVELGIYLDHFATGKGMGSALYKALLEKVESLGHHVAIGGVALPNPASETLHVKVGMKQVAKFEAVGFKFGKWIDVAYYQKTFGETDDGS